MASAWWGMSAKQPGAPVSDSGIGALDAMIAKLKILGGQDVATRVAQRAAPMVDQAIKKTASAGQTPYGQAWKAKKDGGRALVNAASHIATSSSGNTITTTLTGPDVFHQKGLQGKPRRQVIPDTGNVPPAVEEALVEAAKIVFKEITES